MPSAIHLVHPVDSPEHFNFRARHSSQAYSTLLTVIEGDGSGTSMLELVSTGTT